MSTHYLPFNQLKVEVEWLQRDGGTRSWDIVPELYFRIRRKEGKAGKKIAQIHGHCEILPVSISASRSRQPGSAGPVSAGREKLATDAIIAGTIRSNMQGSEGLPAFKCARRA